MYNVLQILKEAKEQLELINLPTPQLDVEVLLSHYMNKDRVFLHIYPDMEISREICRKFWEAVEKRKRLMPIQYIINRQQFMGLDFYIDEGVLIPRGDTEILVQEVLHIYEREKRGEEVKILDIGTGSGAITVSLGKLIDSSKIYSIDISEKALNIATINAKEHGVINKVELLQGSLFEPLKNKNLEGELDFIVSNPPYIRTRDVLELEDQVKKYEPILALDGGEDGLYFYRSITTQAPTFLKKGGWLVFEIGFDQGEVLKGLMKDRFTDIKIIKDLAGLDRVIIGKLAKN